MARAGALRLTVDSRPFRRSLGATAWVVLEELALAARVDGSGVVIASTNVRALADELGLVKDTVSGALHRLIAVGVVVRRPQQQQDAGRFGAVVYELRLPAGLSIGPCPEDQDTVRSPASTPEPHALSPCPTSADTVEVGSPARSSRRGRASQAHRPESGQLTLIENETRA